jgi:hypothetical protein
MAFVAIHARLAVFPPRLSASAAASSLRSDSSGYRFPSLRTLTGNSRRTLRYGRRRCRAAGITASLELDLTEDNVRQAIEDAKAEARRTPYLHPFPFWAHSYLDSWLARRSSSWRHCWFSALYFSWPSCSIPRWAWQVKSNPIQSMHCW